MSGLLVDNISQGAGAAGVTCYTNTINSNGTIKLDSLSGNALLYLTNSTKLIGEIDVATDGNLVLTAEKLNTVQAIKTSSSPTFASMTSTGNITINGTPSSSTDATTVAYVDALLDGLKWKEQVVVATTGAITLENEQTIDGIGIVAGDRVLVWQQNGDGDPHLGNGIYVCVDAGAWTRATDANTGTELVNAVCTVEKGATYDNYSFIMITNGPITPDTTAIQWTVKGSETGHNDMSSIQGGNGSTEYYHLTSADHTELTAWIEDVTLSDGGDMNLGTGNLTAFNVTASGTLYTNTIDGGGSEIVFNHALQIDYVQEKTSDNGVRVDDSLIKDNNVFLDQSETNTYVKKDGSGNMVFNVATGKKFTFTVNDVTVAEFTAS